MRYIDLDTSEIRKQMTGSPVACETGKRGLPKKYPVQFVRDAEVIELEDVDEETPAAVILGFKAPAGYDSVAYVLGPFTAVKTGGGETEDPATYTFTIVPLSALLDQLLATNLDSVTLVPEIKWTSLDENGETLAFDWEIQNNVHRGGESVPSYPVTAAVVDLPQVTRLTGGVLATDLDAQLLAGYPNGSKFDVTTDIGDGVLGDSRWQKRTGAELVTNVADGVIVCTDGTRLYRTRG